MTHINCLILDTKLQTDPQFLEMTYIKCVLPMLGHLMYLCYFINVSRGYYLLLLNLSSVMTNEAWAKCPESNNSLSKGGIVTFTD